MKKIISRKVSECRICNEKLKEILNLGKHINTGYFPSKIDETQPKLPLRIYICQNKKCELVQLGDNYNLNYLFGIDYGYRSGLNKSMVNHLHKLFLETPKRFKNKKLNILDIGSNDGTLLNFFGKKHSLYAVDPTIMKFKKYYNKNIQKIPYIFNNQITKYFKNKNINFNVIYTISMFYDLPRPKEFVKNISDVLNENGIWIVENSYLLTMLKKNSIDTICHEHIEYYSIKSISFLLSKFNLFINDIKFNDINGGSFTLFISKKKKKFNKLDKLIKYENANTLKMISSFKKNIINIKNKIKKFLDINLKDKKSFYLYGASTKGNTLINFFKINSSQIPYALDINLDKKNKFTPGSNIKILNKITKLDSNVIFFVSIWHFKKFILKNERELLNKGVKFLFPLPKPHVVSKEKNKIKQFYL